MNGPDIYIACYEMLTSLGDCQQTIASIKEGRSGLGYYGKAGMIAGKIPEDAETKFCGANGEDNQTESCGQEGNNSQTKFFGQAESGADLSDDISGRSENTGSKLTRFERIIVSCIEKVCRQSGVSMQSPDTQLIISSTKGNIEMLHGAGDPDLFIDGKECRKVLLTESADAISRALNAANSPIFISNACISGVSAFNVARNLIESKGFVNVMVAGADLLSEFITEGFKSFKSLSSGPCKPYDASRDGLTLGEAGAAILLTTDKSKVGVPAVRLLGTAVSDDANHISAPSRTGDGLSLAISEAMRQSGINPSEVAFVNAHGTGTVYNDEMESKAMSLSGLSGTPLNSLKGYIGHTLGASGVVETILSAVQLADSELFGTKGFENDGTPCPLAVSAGNIRLEDAKYCLKTASGFGGCNAALVLGLSNPMAEPENLHTSESVVMKSDKPGRKTGVVAQFTLPQSDLPFDEFIRNEYHDSGLQYPKFYKMSDLCKAVLIAAERLIAKYPDFERIPPERRSIILGNKYSSLEADIIHSKIVESRLPEGASPSVFVYTLPNVAAGEVCIRHKICGDNTFFIGDGNGNFAEEYAGILVSQGKTDAAICGWCDKIGGYWDVRLKIIADIENNDC